MILSRYMTRGFRGNSVHAPVHVFSNEHDRLDLSSDKRHLTATVFKSLSRQTPGDGYQVLVASANPLLSAHVEAEHDGRMEIVPLAAAKHMAELMGMGLVVLESVHCDTLTRDTWWELFYYTPRASTRDALGREILTPP
jgi:hypothetical protein